VARIGVVGSVALDVVVRLREPLSAGRHLEAEPGGERIGGGGANVALALAHAGHAVALVSALGQDAAAARLASELAGHGVDDRAVVRVAGDSTRSLVLVDPSGERTVVNLHRCREAAPPERLRGLELDALYVRSRAEALAPLLEGQLRRALVIAHVPPSGAGERPAHGLVASAADLEPEALADPWALGRRVAGEALRFVVVTHGSRGATAFTASERFDAPAPETRVVDTTGAGDAFAAGLVHALVARQPLAQALRTAVSWGAMAVGHAGSALSADCVARLCAV
jgi:sugar/nucleoside kinase (ribokinase family)